MSAAHPAPPAEPGPGVALVVEDDPLSHELITELLRADGWLVVGTATAEEAIEAAHKSRPRLVVMDIGLPGMGGLEAMRVLRADPRTAGMAIIALTAQAMAGDADRGIAAGFDDYLTKPVNTRTFFHRVHAVLARRGATRGGA